MTRDGRASLATVVVVSIAYVVWLGAHWLGQPLSSGHLALAASRVWDLERSISSGNGLPWWTPWYMDGSSYALVNGQGLAQMAWVLLTPIFGIFAAGKILMLASLGGAGIAMYFCARHFLAHDGAAAIAALAYLLAPEHLVRAGAAEHVGAVVCVLLVPLVWLCVARALADPRAGTVVPAAIVSAAMLATDEKQTLVQATYLAAYLGYLLARTDVAGRARIGRAAAAIAGLTAIMCAFAIVPAFVERHAMRLFEGDDISSWQRQFQLHGLLPLVDRSGAIDGALGRTPSAKYVGWSLALCVVAVAWSRPREARPLRGLFLALFGASIALGAGLRALGLATAADVAALFTRPAPLSARLAAIAGVLVTIAALARVVQRVGRGPRQIALAAMVLAAIFLPPFRALSALPLFDALRAPGALYDLPHVFFGALVAGFVLVDVVPTVYAARAPRLAALLGAVFVLDAWPMERPFFASDVDRATIDRAWSTYAALGKEPGWSRVYAITSRYFHLMGPAHGGPPHALEAGFTFMQPRGSGMLHMTSVQSLRLQRAYLDVSGARWLLFDKSDPVSRAPVLVQQLEAYRRIFPVQIEDEDFVVFRNDRASPFVRGYTRGCIAFGDSRALPKIALELALRGYALVHADGEELADVPVAALAAYDCVYTAREGFIPDALPPAVAARVAFHDDPELELPPPSGELDPLVLGAIERPSNERVRISVAAPRRAMAVVSESYYPFWRATLDGRPVTLLRLQYGMMGMPLTAGDHVIELAYERPVAYLVAAWTSALTVLGALALVMRARRPRVLKET